MKINDITNKLNDALKKDMIDNKNLTIINNNTYEKTLNKLINSQLDLFSQLREFINYIQIGYNKNNDLSALNITDFYFFYYNLKIINDNADNSNSINIMNTTQKILEVLKIE